MKLRFVVTKKRLKWRWIRQLEKPEAINALMCACLVDDEGEYYGAVEAQEVLDDLDLEQFEDATKAFRTAMEDYTIPPASAAS